MEGNYVRKDHHQNKNNGEENLSLEENSWGGSWLARNYACSFCKREFRSAQGLGGHMNVHRRDRARLRSGIIPPLWLHNNSDSLNKPNPIASSKPPSNYPNSLTSSSSMSDDKKSPVLVTSSSKLPLLSPQSTRSGFRSVKEEMMKGCAAKEKGLKGNFEDIKVDDNNNITLELGLGSLLQNPKEQIDLELRLGHL